MRCSTPLKLSPRLAMDGFIPNELLRSLIDEGHVTCSAAMIHGSDGRRYVVQEAVRVLGRSNSESGSDPFGCTGMIATLAELLDRGFVLSTEHIRLGRSTYDIEHGVICHPLALLPAATADESGVNPAVTQ